MKFIAFLSVLFLILTPANAKEFRIDFSDEGMKLFKKRGFGKEAAEVAAAWRAWTK